MSTTCKRSPKEERTTSRNVPELELSRTVVPQMFYDIDYAENLYWADRAAYYDYMQCAAERYIEFGA